MNLQEMKQLKEKLIIDGRAAYPTIVKITETLGELKFIHGRSYIILEHEDITLIYGSYPIRAKVGKDGFFQGWLYRSSIFVSVGEMVPLCPFRRDRVMYIFLDNEMTSVSQEDRDNEIFVPYYKNWYERILLLLPKAESILGEVSKQNSETEKEKLSKQLFINTNYFQEWR